ncbi:hypothetical protein C2S53_018187 [Perilla frutescens var. hirtella]|uniref:Prephenate/arogenate dehydrogenase domain-containing protein n=1 Tax=Perilla frutescens var. hirtella TaxID=608512 RepID=A0AAD4JP94_PERFH|nr:hypothetical protein C2S53_018187 [Perilla frutescens var. hirtella]
MDSTMADNIAEGNRHIVCQYKDNIATFGIWINRNPLNFSLPLILLQLATISFSSLLIEVFLRPLGQSSIVAQILGGIMFGPSVLGHDGLMGHSLFPARSIVTLETAAVFGIMFFLFAIGVRTDTKMMVRPQKQALVLGFSAMFFTLILSMSLALIMKAYISMDSSLAKALPFLGAAQCLTAFSNVSCLLMELKMASSDLGRIASSTAMFTDFIGMLMFVVMAAVVQSGFELKKALQTLGSSFLFLSVMAYIIRPIILKIVKRIPIGKPLGDNYVFLCFTSILVTGFITETIGQHFLLGPLVLGFIVPDGPPLGAPMVAKLDLPVGKFLYPTFLTTSGIKTNIFKINLRSFWIIGFLIFSACLTKIVSIVLASRFLDIEFYDSVVIGLILNARGICELLLFNLWRDGGVCMYVCLSQTREFLFLFQNLINLSPPQVLTDQEFALSVISVVGVTAVITPLIKLLYDPSKRIIPHKRRTIQHAKRDAELRIMICIHNQENVPSMINLLEASHATELSPIAVIAVVLEEVIGRITNMLVSHQSTRTLDPNSSRSGHIVSALRQYELYNQTCVTIQPFSAVSHLQTVHDDIYRLAMDQSATIVILPFHKHWEIDGSIGSTNKAIQTMNIKVLENAPCSVGILVDRGILTGSLSILTNQFVYRAAVIYIGGPDDAESLCYGARLAGHDNVTLTVIRFLLYGCDSARERKQDNCLIDEVRHQNVENQNFVYQEQVVKDGVGLAASLRALENCFDLMIVGRNHQSSQILMGLGAWSECPELGVVGDILAAPDFGSTASVLVVQQQRFRGENKLMNRMMKPGRDKLHPYCLPTHATMSSPSKKYLKIGIIGFGAFAQFLVKTMMRQGHTVRATSRSDYTDLCNQLGVSFFRDTSEFLESDNDVILLSTSILSLSQVVEELPLNCLKQPTLFVDVLSVKEYPRDLMLRALPHDSDVLCTHPMFGPESGKDGWNDLSFMFDKVRIRNEATCSTFLQIFATEGCKMMEMSCEEHDKLSARSQFLTHTIGRVLAEMEVEPTPIDTKGFQKLVQVKESTSRDSFDLFSGLFVHNRFAKQQLRNLELAFDSIKQQLVKRNEELEQS